MLLSMNEDLKNRFNEDGFVVVKDLLKPSEIEFYREVIKEAIKERKLLDERKLKDKSIYTFALNNKNELIEFKRIEIGERVRDMVYDNQKKEVVLFLEDILVVY